MSDERVPMTLEGKRALEEELRNLKHHERPRIVKAIEEARMHGDLSENAEYKYAKERQSFIEGRIQEIGDKLARADIIDVAMITSSKVMFGATVTLLDIEKETEVIYKIVGTDEADVKKKKISISSPIARALLGKEAGDDSGRTEPRHQLDRAATLAEETRDFFIFVGHPPHVPRVILPALPLRDRFFRAECSLHGRECPRSREGAPATASTEGRQTWAAHRRPS